MVGLPADELVRPHIEEKTIPEPKISKTPYTAQISDTESFFNEMKDSDLAKRGIKDFSDGHAKETILPRHLKNLQKVS